jgi:hypothetical protein
MIIVAIVAALVVVLIIYSWVTEGKNEAIGHDEYDPIEEQGKSIERTVTLFSAPHDPELWKIAEQRKSHIDMKSVSDEYDRLILEKRQEQGDERVGNRKPTL